MIFIKFVFWFKNYIFSPLNNVSIFRCWLSLLKQSFIVFANSLIHSSFRFNVLKVFHVFSPISKFVLFFCWHDFPTVQICILYCISILRNHRIIFGRCDWKLVCSLFSPSKCLVRNYLSIHHLSLNERSYYMRF